MLNSSPTSQHRYRCTDMKTAFQVTIILEYLPNFSFEMCIAIVLNITSKNNTKYYATCVIFVTSIFLNFFLMKFFCNLFPDVSINLKFFKVGTTLPIDLFVNLKTFIKLLKFQHIAGKCRQHMDHMIWSWVKWAQN